MILLFSGGMDSYIAWHYLNKPKTVYFDLGTPYAQKEIKVIKQLVPDTIIETCLNLKDRQIGDYFIPYRNLYFALLANKYSDDIVMAGLKDDGIEDKNEAIFAEWSLLLSKMINRHVMVTSPFWEMTKEDIVKWYIDNGHDIGLLMKTVSCYSEEDLKYICESLYPDIRRIINTLQRNSISGELKIDKGAILTTERKIITSILEIINFINSNQKNKIGNIISEIINLLNERDIEYKRIYEDLFFRKEIPPNCKIAINKYSNDHQTCLVPSMHFMALIFEMINNLTKYLELLGKK